MAIPGAGEMMPGMNTQARKPAFEPKGDVMPIPEQPAPMKKPESIREYLQTLQAGQVPTFTNIPGQTGTFSEGQGAMAFQDIGPGAGGPVVPFPEQGAIPEKPEEKKIEGKNPYEKAKNALPTILPDLKEQFDMKYGNNTSLEEYDNLWAQAVNHANNQLIKSFEKEGEKMEKDGMDLLKRGFDPETIKKWQDSGGKDISVLAKKFDWEGAYEKGMKAYNGLSEYDPIKETMSAEDYARQWANNMEKELQRRFEEQRDRDNRARGGTQSKQITPEQQKLIQQAKALNDQLKTTTNQSTGQPLTPAERLDIIRGNPKFKTILGLL